MGLAVAPDQISRVRAADFTCDLDLLDDEVWRVLDLAGEMKKTPGRYAQALAGKSIALLFEKPSLRTRMTFELAVQQLGGASVFAEGLIGLREPLKDVARNLDRWVNAIVARTFSHDTIDELARWSKAPVINALSDLYHPCQVLADALTLLEALGDLRGKKLAFIGDGNNVSHSLMLTCSRLGMDFAIGCPAGYEPNPDIVVRAGQIAGSPVMITNDPGAAVRGAHAVYTDVWASMGQEEQSTQRRAAFTHYQVNEHLLAKAQPEAIFLHCLPAKRGEEVTDAVMESPRSRVFDQAENRLHTQKALLLLMI
jgi:ornithine carbamoyltransferase